MARNKVVPKFELCSSGVPSPEAVDELHCLIYKTNRTLYNPSTAREGKNDYNNKTVHNPKYFWNLLFDYKIKNSKIKKFYDRT